MECVPVKGSFCLRVKELIPYAPVRVVMVHNAETEVGCKALVEPQILPVRGADEISEPLMRHFVCDHFTYPLLAGPGCCFRIVEDQVFPEGDGAPVLHGAKGEVSDCNQVELGQWVFDSIVVFAVLEGFSAEIESEFCKVCHPRCGGRSDKNLLARIFQEFEGSHTKEQQVC